MTAPDCAQDTSGLIFRIETFVDPATRGPWLRLLLDIFAIDLGTASALNVWSGGYRAFSYWAGDEIAANVSLRPLPMIVGGTKAAAGQLHAVATRPAYRRRGLFQDLMCRTLTQADRQFDRLLLYTETPALYAPFGFRPLTEQAFSGRLAAADSGVPEHRDLAIGDSDDRALILRLFRERQPVSERLGLCGNEDIFVAHAVARTDWHLSYLPREDALIVWDKPEGRVRLLDIVGPVLPQSPTLAALFGTREIDVLFPPDLLAGSFAAREHVPEDHDILMVRGPFAPERDAFMLPLTALS